MSKITVSLDINHKAGGFKSQQSTLAWIEACLNCNTNNAQVKAVLVDPPAEVVKPRVLVTVSGGVAETIADSNADVCVFDWDNFKSGQSQTFESAVPARFADLAGPAGVPVRNEDGSHVVMSDSEFAEGDKAGFWSNEDGWTELEGATRFSTEERLTMVLPMSANSDSIWVGLSEAQALVEAATLASLAYAEKPKA